MKMTLPASQIKLLDIQSLDWGVNSDRRQGKLRAAADTGYVFIREWSE